MKVKDVIKLTEMKEPMISACINQTVNFKIHAYLDSKMVFTYLPKEIEKKILNLNVESYKINSYSIDILTEDINKDGIFIKNY